MKTVEKIINKLERIDSITNKYLLDNVDNIIKKADDYKMKKLNDLITTNMLELNKYVSKNLSKDSIEKLSLELNLKIKLLEHNIKKYKRYENNNFDNITEDFKYFLILKNIENEDKLDLYNRIHSIFK